MTIAGTTLLVAVAAFWATARLAVELVYCYLPWSFEPNDTPLCGPSIWGHAAVPFALLVLACVLGTLWAHGAASTLVRQVGGAVRFRRKLLTAQVDHPLSQRLGKADLSVVDLDVPLALTIGVLRPRIVISTYTINHLDRQQLDAVIEHERHHLRRRDPATYVLVRAAAAATAFIPATGAWADQVITDAEVAADSVAVERIGRRPLASALLFFDEAGDGEEAMALGSIRGKINPRIEVLAGGALDHRLSRAVLVRSVLATLVAAVPAVALAAAVSRM